MTEKKTEWFVHTGMWVSSDLAQCQTPCKARWLIYQAFWSFNPRTYAKFLPWTMPWAPQPHPQGGAVFNPWLHLTVMISVPPEESKTHSEEEAGDNDSPTSPPPSRSWVPAARLSLLPATSDFLTDVCHSQNWSVPRATRTSGFGFVSLQVQLCWLGRGEVGGECW